MTFPPGGPLMVVMAYRSSDPQRPCGLLACTVPLNAAAVSRGYPWALLPHGGEPQVLAPGDVMLSVVMPAPGVIIIESVSWGAARAELARMLDRQRVRGADQSAAWYDEMASWQPASLEATVLGGDGERRAAAEELPPDQREHYDGAYARVPRLSPDEALEMIDAAIEEAQRS
jgi:hypothetical protein